MNAPSWHLECLPEGLWKLAQNLAPIAAEHGAVLAGGTALALKLGHRISVDLDFFCAADVRHERILAHVRKGQGEPRILVEDPESLMLLSGKTKVSFFRHEYPFLDTAGELDGIRIAGNLDIAAMKLIAISQRGLKRDFVDLYTLLQTVPAFQISGHAVRRYGRERINPMVIGKALVYFTDAEGEPDPNYPKGRGVAWTKVKSFFRAHAKRLVLDLDGAVK